MNPKAVGERSEAMVLARFLRAGLVVLTPFGDSQRYDMVVDDDGTFVRIQCKTGRLKDGKITFPTCSTNWNQGTRRDYRGEIELFAVYCPETDLVYLVPIGEVGIKVATLRVTLARNGQTKNVRLASDYLFNGSLTQLVA